jgi:hypothetical protein
VAAPPGGQRLTVLGRRPFDGQRYAEDMTTLLGPDDWKHMQRVDRIGLFGCLPFVVLAVTLLARKWEWLSILAPLVVVCWLPFLGLKQGRRYKEARRRVHEQEQARPHYVFTLSPAAGDLPAGGFLRV